MHKGEDEPIDTLKSTDMILQGLGTVNLSNDDERMGSKKKFKKVKKTPHYLIGTANSRAKTVTKSPMNDTKGKKTHRRGTSPFNGNKDSYSQKASEKTSKEVSLWIEELPINDLRLEYNHFTVAYKEYRVLNELTIIIL